MTTRRIPLLVIAAAALVIPVGCSSSGDSSSESTTSADTSAADTSATDAADISGEVTVFAAASLRDTFEEIGNDFTEQYPDASVRFTFAGSSDLVAQLTSGAPGDVFASADENNMTKATDAGLIAGDPVDFASNTLTIVTPPGNPGDVQSFADLAEPDLSVVVCAPPVPCGAATNRIEEATGVDITPVSEESSVTDVLGKVTSGQADAGLVYVTDATGAGDAVDVVNFPESSDAVNVYPIGVLEDSANTEAAQAFVDMVTGQVGQGVLAEAGFAQP